MKKSITIELSDLDIAVLEQLGADYTYEDGVLTMEEEDFGSLSDISNHGIDGGFSGFIYYAETTKFYKDNKNDIDAALESFAEMSGVSVGELLCGFGCFKNNKYDANAMEILWRDGESELKGVSDKETTVEVEVDADDLVGLDEEGIEEKVLENAEEDEDATIESYEDIEEGDSISDTVRTFKITGIVWESVSEFDESQYPDEENLQNALAWFAGEETAHKISNAEYESDSEEAEENEEDYLPSEASVDLDLGYEPTDEEVQEAIEANYGCEILSYDSVIADPTGGHTMLGIVWGSRY